MMIQEVFLMSTIGTVLTVILIVLTVVLACIILMQSKRSAVNLVG